ncbi:MAG: 30S ribosome-binding factor RbfA [Marinisporobacter sp.]|jgi:ribosome-binding factor A|nr:30S ribosome-binding factor RbfA [Marinisporobacter sp.]
MGYQRANRISEEIKKLVSTMIMNELKDPRISTLTSVVEVDVTRDLRYANIFISVYGSEKERDNTLTALKSASGFIRKEIGRKLKLRYTPEPIFNMDTSIEKGIYMSSLINKVSKKETLDEKEDK